MPLGQHRIKIGIMLRDAMFTNTIINNSEVLHSKIEKHIEYSQIMNRLLLRFITGAEGKVQSDFFFI